MIHFNPLDQALNDFNGALQQFHKQNSHDLIRRLEISGKWLDIAIAICKSQEKIIVQDILVLQRLKAVAICEKKLNRHFTNLTEEHSKEENSFLTIAQELDNIITARAAFPFISLPNDLICLVLSYLPLSSIIHLDVALSYKVTSTKKEERLIYNSLVKELLYANPGLITHMSKTSVGLKAYTFKCLSDRFRTQNQVKFQSFLVHIFSELKLQTFYLHYQTDRNALKEILKNIPKDKTTFALYSLSPQEFNQSFKTLPVKRLALNTLKGLKTFFREVDHLQELYIETFIEEPTNNTYWKKLFKAIKSKKPQGLYYLNWHLGLLTNVKLKSNEIKSFRKILSFFPKLDVLSLTIWDLALCPKNLFVPDLNVPLLLNNLINQSPRQLLFPNNLFPNLPLRKLHIKAIKHPQNNIKVTKDDCLIKLSDYVNPKSIQKLAFYCFEHSKELEEFSFSLPFPSSYASANLTQFLPLNYTITPPALNLSCKTFADLENNTNVIKVIRSDSVKKV